MEPVLPERLGLLALRIAREIGEESLGFRVAPSGAFDDPRHAGLEPVPQRRIVGPLFLLLLGFQPDRRPLVAQRAGEQVQQVRLPAGRQIGEQIAQRLVVPGGPHSGVPLSSRRRAAFSAIESRSRTAGEM